MAEIRGSSGDVVRAIGHVTATLKEE